MQREKACFLEDCSEAKECDTVESSIYCLSKPGCPNLFPRRAKMKMY